MPNPRSSPSQSNDRVLLDALLERRHALLAPDLTPPQFFELFAAEQALRDADLSYQEVLSGLCGGGNDGGIDGLYTFLNGSLISDIDDLPESIPTRSSVTIVAVQAKRANGFSGSTIDSWRATFGDLLDLSADLADIAVKYSAELLRLVDIARTTYLQASVGFPSLTFRAVYATLGTEVHPTVDTKSRQLEAFLSSVLTGATVNVELLGAPELLMLAREVGPAAIQLRVSEAAMSADERGGHVALVTLSDYYDFITAGGDSVHQPLFDLNVRDYEGDVAVNGAIRNTLVDHRPGEDFWWLNNGVTIVANQVTQVGRTLNIEAPKIVNGLQTSMEILRTLSADNAEETRRVLVRVVVPPDDQCRDRIIHATNYQTLIPSIALHATEKVHRDIEDFFTAHDFRYERRRNSFKNQSCNIRRVVTIPDLAEAVLATVFAEPHLGNPRLGGNFLKSEKEYSRIFTPDAPIEGYLSAIRVVQRVDEFLDQLAHHDRRHLYKRLRYIVAMCIAIRATGSLTPGWSKVADMDVSAISERSIRLLFEGVASDESSLFDQVAPRDRGSTRLERRLVSKVRTRMGAILAQDRQGILRQ